MITPRTAESDRPRWGRGRISIDRIRSCNAGFHAKFPGVLSAPIPEAEGRVKLHVYVDACSVEVFVNDGEQVLTSLVFPPRTGRAVELFGPSEGATVSAIEAWQLASCRNAEWPERATTPENGMGTCFGGARPARRRDAQSADAASRCCDHPVLHSGT